MTRQIMSIRRARELDRRTVAEYVDVMVLAYRELMGIPDDVDVDVNYSVHGTGTMQVTFKEVTA